MNRSTKIEIAAQPDDRTCGATCLHALYRHFGLSRDLTALTDEIPQLPDGGTLGVHLAIHALEDGFNADIHTYNLQLFDPTWFEEPAGIAEKLRHQRAVKDDPRIASSTDAYLRFLELGGRIHFEELNRDIIRRSVERGPVLVGLSATYLYGSVREDARTDADDDIGGTPVGHFVLLESYDAEQARVVVADPWAENPMAPGRGQHYEVGYDRLAGAILLSIVTYDANLLSVTKKPTQ